MLRFECPACKTQRDIDSKSLGQTVTCPCGATSLLMADSATPPKQLHVVCSNCDEQYDVDPQDAGEEMECECGTDVWVPFLVHPLKEKKKLKKKLKPKPAKQAPSSTAAQSPWRNRAKTLTGKPDMGIRLSVPATPQESKPAGDPQADSPLTLRKPQERSATKNEEEEGNEEHAAKREKRLPWTEIVFATAIALFLIVAVVAYATRGPRRAATKPADAEETTATPSNSGAVADASAVNASKNPQQPAVIAGSSTTSQDTTTETESGDSSLEAPQRSATSKAIVAGAGGETFLLGKPGETPTSDPTPPVEKTQPATKSKDAKPSDARRPAARKSNEYPAIPLSDITPPPHDDQITDRPAAKTPRPELSLTGPSQRNVPFQRAYQRAYEAHQTYQAMKTPDGNAAARDEALTQAIDRFLICRDAFNDKVTAEQQHQILYTLASLYLDAGHLYESTVLASHLVFHAPAEDPTSKAAAMIMLVALQEAHQTQFGDRDRPGELKQIARLGDHIAARWPKHPKLDVIRYSNAQSLESDGFLVAAAKEFAKVSKASDLYGKSQCSAGRLLWMVALAKEEADPNDPQIQGTVSAAAQYFDSGIEQFEAEPTAALVAAMLARAQIELRRENADAAVRLLGAEGGVTGLVRKEMKLSEEFVTVAHETLFQAYMETDDIDRIQSTLQVLRKRYGPSGRKKISQLYTKVAKDFLSTLPAGPSITPVHLDQFERVADSIVKARGNVPMETKLWLAQQWSDLATRTRSEPDAMRCYESSAAILKQLVGDRSVEANVKLSLQLTLIETYRDSQQLDQALDAVREILSARANAIEVQLTAARILRDRASESPSQETYREAIRGEGQSNVWGWQTLTTTLMNLRFSNDNVSDSPERLHEAIFSLNDLRLQMAGTTTDTAQRQALVRDASRQVNLAMTTIVSDDSPWRQKLSDLQSRINQQMQ